jgi:hypothetical protein
LHFFKKLAFAAPASGLPSLLTALLSQVPCADAEAKFNDSSNAARRTRFMSRLPIGRESALRVVGLFLDLVEQSFSVHFHRLRKSICPRARMNGEQEFDERRLHFRQGLADEFPS